MPTLSAVAKRLRIHLSADQLDAFDVYFRQLIAQRSRAGLTSLTDRESIERRHFLESLVLLRALEEAGAFSSPAIDIGTGAGFPGLPIKIARPELELTLLEATGKKVKFLSGLIELLALDGVTAVQARAEDLGHDPSHRGAYNLALARAVGPLRILTELALPFLRIGGRLATPKGSGAMREAREAVAALEATGGEIERIEKLELPWPGVSPTLILVRKTAETPDRYPRRAGMAAKRPL